MRRRTGWCWLVGTMDCGLPSATLPMACCQRTGRGRAARLLGALTRRDWASVWSSLSLADLFFLAARLRDAGVRQPDRSPAIAEYLALAHTIPAGSGARGSASRSTHLL